MGEILGKYELLGHLATGGMAEIHLACQRGLRGFSKLVVIKRLLPSLAKDPAVVSLFLNEARIAAKLNHANVVQIYDLGRVEDSYYIAMEYIQGVDLRMMLQRLYDQREQLLLQHILFIAKQVCDGLHYAHSLSDATNRPLDIVHCDVSPQNIVVSFDGMVKIVDFGIARAAARIEQTTPGLIFGKYGYMSPEQLQGTRLDARSDIFSLGVTLWELCSARRLFPFSNLDQVKKMILRGKVASVRQYNYQISPALNAIIKRALALDCDTRFQTTLEMGAALEQEMRRLGLKSSSLDLGTMMRQMFSDKQAHLRRIEKVQASREDPRNDVTIVEREAVRGSKPSWMMGHEIEENPPSRGGLKVARNFTISSAAQSPGQIRIRSHSPRAVKRAKQSVWTWLFGVVLITGLVLLGGYGSGTLPQIQSMFQRVKGWMIVEEIQLHRQPPSEIGKDGGK